MTAVLDRQSNRAISQVGITRLRQVIVQYRELIGAPRADEVIVLIDKVLKGEYESLEELGTKLVDLVTELQAREAEVRPRDGDRQNKAS